MTPVVLVTADQRLLDGYQWHAAIDTYLKAVSDAAGAVPLILPALGERIDIDAALDRVDGVLVTGSRSNVHPEVYGEAPAPTYEPYDPARDATSLPLIRRAIARGLPLLAICRGHQELNVALGGTLATEIQETTGRMDHRAPQSEVQDERFAIRHRVEVKDGSCLAGIVGAGAIEVNSLHRQAIEKLAPNLAVEATAPDGTIEAVRVSGAPGFTLGLQWHPEYWATSDAPSKAIFAAFSGELKKVIARRQAGERI
ncbi:MAG: gamma-glutamyl-gamma-aminobutyrate hydrolase family protein [Hyphomicrobiaceae bacterium]|nr:gamma-glutamyl-gamma-aminobutyrate hydrolase family protein [Hyphomicrobiaceae bacterium]